MRLSSLASARPAYYDRNATSAVNAYEATLTGASALTTRWTRTIPAGRKMLVETIQTYWDRRTAASANGQVLGYVRLTAADTTDMMLLQANQYVSSNTVGVKEQIQLATQPTMYASEIVYYQTVITDTGGSILFQGTLKGTLYDA